MKKLIITALITLLTFAVTAYVLIACYYVFVNPDGPQTALSKGEVYVRGIIRSKDDEIVALEKKACSVDDCHMMFSEEVLIKKSAADEPYVTGETVIVHLDQGENLAEYRRSEIQNGLLNKKVFTIQSMEENRLDLKTVDKGKVISSGILGLSILVSVTVGWLSFGSKVEKKSRKKL